MASPCPLLSLPIELLLRITDYLAFRDFANCRLICHAVHDNLDKYFGEEFFTRRQFMLAPISLRVLHEISHSRFAGTLRHLHIGIEDLQYLSDAHSEAQLALQLEDNTLHDGFLQFKELLAEDLLWLISGKRQKILSDSLNKLSALETVVIRDCASHRKVRNGASGCESYGMPTVCGLLQVAPEVARGPDSFSLGCMKQTEATVVACVLHALATAPSCPATGLEVLGRHKLHFQDWHFLAPQLTMLQPLLGRLEKLHLVLDFRFVRNESGASAGKRSRGPAALLTECRSLRDLRLNNSQGRHTLAFDDLWFFDWLSDSPDHVLPQLDTLSIGKVPLKSETLVRLLCRFQHTLRKLELWRVALTSQDLVMAQGADQLLLESVQQRVETLWPTTLLRWMHQPGFESLRHVKLGMLSVQVFETASRDWDGLYETFYRRFFVGFSRPTTDTNSQASDPVVSYTGIDWRTFVKESLLRVETHAAGTWRSGPRRVPSSHNEDGSDGDDVT